MPGFNRRGPMGQGPMTGKGFGLCATEVPGALGGRGLGRGRSAASGAGRGRGKGLGRCGSGRGYRTGYPTDVMTASDETEILKSELDEAKRRVSELESRLSELETPQTEE